MKTYVVSLENSDENFELPLWQISEPMRRGKLGAYLENALKFQRIYAVVLLDGLPMRSEPSNVARQIYRLRKDEIIKVLAKGESEILTAGANNFEGAWYQVMAEGGTTGWCFSYNLRLFNEATDSPEVAQKNETDAADLILKQKWYPESYRKMVENGRVDIGEMQKGYEFCAKDEAGKTTLRAANHSLSFDYAGLEKLSEGTYRLKGNSLKVIVRRDDYILLQFTTRDGNPVSLGFSTLPQPIDEVLRAEQERRDAIYAAILAGERRFENENFGEIHFMEGRRFEWAGYEDLSPTIIPQNAGEQGTLSFDSFLSNALSTLYDGVMTFRFDGCSEPVSFLYRFDHGTLVLEDSIGAQWDEKMLVERSSNPKICRFSPVGGSI